MIQNFNILLFLGFFILFPASEISARPWTFVKEKDGIKVYTRTESNSSWKSFKGEVTFQTTMDKVMSLLGNETNNDWWDKAITDVKVLGYEEDEFIQYYMVYNLPWPFTNRDIVTDTRITTDTVTGVRIYSVKPLPNRVPEKSNLVRIEEYWQIWTIQLMAKDYVHVTFEGSLNPGGNIPPWLYNMVVNEVPLKMLETLREKASTKLQDV